MEAPAAALSPETAALFEALLLGNTQAALALLRIFAARPAHTVPGGFTSLHAAVAGRCHEALLPLVIAGAPLNGVLQEALLCMNHGYSALWDLVRGMLTNDGFKAVKKMVRKMFLDGHWFPQGFTPLGCAVRLQDLQSVRQLLDLGADPNAGNLTALAALPDRVKKGHIAPITRQLLHLLLQCGADCLLPGSGGHHHTCALIEHLSTGLGPSMLAHLQRQQAAGELQLDGKQRTADLVRAAIRGSHHPLLSHGIGRLESLLVVGAPPGQQAPPALAPQDADLLASILFTALDLKASKVAGLLQVLLASQLPFDLSHTQGHGARSPLATAALGGARAVAVPLLLQAGAQLSAADVLQAASALSPQALAALLSHGCPAVDCSQPTADGGIYSCPVHHILRCMAHYWQKQGQLYMLQDCHDLRWKSLRTMELLLEAGYRPTVYRNVSPPPFLQLAQGVRAVLDPFDFHPPWLLNTPLGFVARGGTWSPASHHQWPAPFKAAARMLLIAGSPAGALPCLEVQGEPSNSKKRRRRAGTPTAGCRGGILARLPDSTLLHVLELAAEPMSGWMW